MRMFYVGADVHQTSTTLVVLDHEGRVAKESVIRTTPENLLSEIRALDGDVRFAAEESNHSRWLYELLHRVAEVVICDPKRNKFGDEVHKSDRHDAHGIAELNYLNKLKPIYHGDAVHTELKEIAKAYNRADKRRTNAMNAVRGVFANAGMWTRTGYPFTPGGREQWLSELTNEGQRFRLEQLYAELELADELKLDARKAMIKVSRKHAGWASVSSVPGIGEIRTAQILATIGTPFRFRTSRQLVAYSGFAVVSHSTDEYDANLRRKRSRKTLGLNRNRNSVMKNVFKGAAESTTKLHRNKYPEIAAYYDRRCEEIGRDLATVSVARKLIAITLTLWKRKEVYDPEKAHW